MANYVWVPKVHCTYQVGYVDVAVVRYRVVQFGKTKHTVSGVSESYGIADSQKYPVDICFTDKADAEKKAVEMAKEAIAKLQAMIGKLEKHPRTIDYTQ